MKYARCCTYKEEIGTPSQYMSPTQCKMLATVALLWSSHDHHIFNVCLPHKTVISTKGNIHSPKHTHREGTQGHFSLHSRFWPVSALECLGCPGLHQNFLFHPRHNIEKQAYAWNMNPLKSMSKPRPGVSNIRHIHFLLFQWALWKSFKKWQAI